MNIIAYECCLLCDLDRPFQIDYPMNIIVYEWCLLCDLGRPFQIDYPMSIIIYECCLLCDLGRPFQIILTDGRGASDFSSSFSAFSTF